MQITAAIVREKSGPFVIDTLQLDDPRPDEVLVKVVASGMCHTDLHGRDGYYNAARYPMVFGHEGGGVVAAVGRDVRKVKAGDHVIMSFPWCGHCPNCEADVPAHCLHARELKMDGTRPDGSTLMRQGESPVYSAFFQQSSFGSYAISNERFVVRVRDDAPLEQIGAFACGVQTGAGAVLNVLAPKPGSGIAIFGVGGVGLSALMAAKLSGCDPIIAVDVHEHRLKLARELGATHTINHKDRTDVVQEILKITRNGVLGSIETTASPTVLREAIEALMPLGTCILLGSARAGTEASFETPFLQNGRTVRGVVQGWSQPDTFLPRLVDLMMEGKLPVDRLLTTYPLADINRAAKEAVDGTTIKPVLLMPH